MDASIAHKILDLQDELAKEPDFSDLLAEYNYQNDRFLSILESLSKEQEEIIFGYIGKLIEIHLRTLIFAVSK